ncbi:adenylate kinase [Cavenderia fasciculata]|uniref:Adenylate kinase n=1 Tax=Cavenderia fasciculata TaxID=261658 RepID=F4Q8H9_CACFS|nr:adenylate kinase [Cavenderia fasciculata]EGG16079.1 adenylate kinase [Cavenderia fasciculata]|eukprot:XP_004352404.1 adenylate kinase [Cavenderia fasciculata]
MIKQTFIPSTKLMAKILSSPLSPSLSLSSPLSSTTTIIKLYDNNYCNIRTTTTTTSTTCLKKTTYRSNCLYFSTSSSSSSQPPKYNNQEHVVSAPLKNPTDTTSSTSSSSPSSKHSKKNSSSGNKTSSSYDDSSTSTKTKKSTTTTTTTTTTIDNKESTTNSDSDLEIKDPNIIFNTVWNKLENKHGLENMRFPQEIIFLMGAPASGKGTNTPFISSVRGITAEPIVMSSLLNSNEAKKIKSTGGMVSDSFALQTILEELRRPEYRSGVVVDGFPRTNTQVECLTLLYEKMKSLRKNYFTTQLSSCFPRPVFRVTVLFIEEKESLDRQIRRGQITKETNLRLRAQDLPLLEERYTDTSEEIARKRYKIFRDHYSTLTALKKHFPFSIIDASKSINEVQQSIIKEFKYQSSLELAEETYDMVQRIPLVSDIIVHARVDLVNRLDDYQFRHTDLFAAVINVIDKEFIPTIRRHAIAGSAIARISNSIFSNPLAIDMALDVLSERGFRATVDVRTTHIPHKINPQTMQIETIVHNEYSFRVEFLKPAIREEITLPPPTATRPPSLPPHTQATFPTNN